MAYTNIDDPSAHFQTLLWTGNSTDARALTNDGNSDLQPDWVWLKNRDLGYNHFLQDSSRGNTKVLSSDSTAVESTFTDMVESFDTNGFTVGFDGSQVPNFNGNTFVGWQWKANGGTTSTNTDGDINSTVQVNQDAGFSIVTDSPPNNTARSIGHGLGVAPQVVIRRARNRVENWRVFHSAAGSTGALTLDGTAAYNSSTVLFTGVTSTTFGVGTDFSVNGNYNYISYCFAEKQGYSKFGSYTGTGNRDGSPFIYTGFQPAFIMVKNTASATGWAMFDNKRVIANGDMHYLAADRTDAESGTGFSHVDPVDFLSNGFKVMNSDAWMNSSGTKYIYMAFAEAPFVTSTGIPTTAR
jgi:hypothetical protein